MMATEGYKHHVALVKMLKMGAEALHKTHTSDHTKRCQLLCWHSFGVNMLSTAEGQGLTSPHHFSDSDWDELYGEGGSLIAEIPQHYDYQRMHAACKHTGYDLALSWCAWAAVPFVHWGNLAAANDAMDRMLPAALQCMQDWAPTDHYELMYFKCNWVFWLYAMGRKDDVRAVLDGGPFDSLELMIDDGLTKLSPGVFRPRGQTEGGTVSMDELLTMGKFLEVLVSDEPSSAAVAALPEPQAVAQYGLNLLSVGNVMEFVAGIVTMTPAMLAHERVGNAESALECAAIITEADPVTEGGSKCRLQHYFAHSCRGRALASQDKADEAEAAFEAALEVTAAYGWHFSLQLRCATCASTCSTARAGARRAGSAWRRRSRGLSAASRTSTPSCTPDVRV